MNKILGFFQKESAFYNELKKTLESELYRAQLDLEFLIKAKDRISSELDDTFNVFSASSLDCGFNTQEIAKLEEQRISLLKFIEEQKNKLTEVEEKLSEINDMIQECDKFGNSLNEHVSGIDIIKIQEIERQRIARDIHDSPIQKLTALIHKSEFAMKVLDSDSSRAKLEMEVINKVTRECIDELRKIIYNLRPMSIDDLGFESAVREEVTQVNNLTDMKLNFDFEAPDQLHVDSIITITVLRIIQELCSNSIKHSNGTQIHISIRIVDDIISITFEDNGKGIDEDPLAISRSDYSGYGIQFLKERVRLLGGTVTFTSNDKKAEHKYGVRYQIEISCHNEEI